MLNLNGSLTKAGVKYSTLWSDDFSDDFFNDGCGAGSKAGASSSRSCTSRRCSDLKVPKRRQNRPAASLRQQLRAKQGDHGSLR